MQMIAIDDLDDDCIVLFDEIRNVEKDIGVNIVFIFRGRIDFFFNLKT